jgi:hypothetical protein
MQATLKTFLQLCSYKATCLQSSETSFNASNVQHGIARTAVKTSPQAFGSILILTDLKPHHTGKPKLRELFNFKGTPRAT